METKKLEMEFLDEMEKNFKIRVDNPKEDLDGSGVKAAMTSLIEQGVIARKDKLIKKINKAQTVTTKVQEFKLD